MNRTTANTTTAFRSNVKDYPCGDGGSRITTFYILPRVRVLKHEPLLPTSKWRVHYTVALRGKALVLSNGHVYVAYDFDSALRTAVNA